MALTKEDKERRASQLADLMNHPGWAWVEDWLEKQDDQITKAVKHNIINVRAGETTKWLNYYSGEANLIVNLREFLRQSIANPSLLDKVRFFKKKALDKDLPSS